MGNEGARKLALSMLRFVQYPMVQQKVTEPAEVHQP